MFAFPVRPLWRFAQIFARGWTIYPLTVKSEEEGQEGMCKTHRVKIESGEPWIPRPTVLQFIRLEPELSSPIEIVKRPIKWHLSAGEDRNKERRKAKNEEIRVLAR